MIANQAKPEIATKLTVETEANALAAGVRAAVEGSSDPFEVEPTAEGLEILALAPLPSGVPNRARMKIFSPKAGHTLILFFKKSLVPYSRDRYSYGGIDCRAPNVEAEEISAWLDFLSSGFHPDKRPQKLRRAFPYESPP